MVKVLQRIDGFGTVGPGSDQDQLVSSMRSAIAAESAQAAFSIFAGWIPRDRFEFVACAELCGPNLGGGSTVVATNFPESWHQEYGPGHYEDDDPVNMLVARKPIPFYWNEARDYAGQVLGQRSRAMKVMQAAVNHGLCDGITFPFQGPNGYTSCISLSGVLGCTDLHPDHRTRLFMLANVVQRSMCELTIRKAPLSVPASLTEREIECLGWAGRGKTEVDIADILSVTKNTVHSHITAAIKKLNADNRIHAYAKATALGLLTPRLD